MSKQLRFDDRVVIVTGAGGGLGRSHALLLASRGAKVVVNDLGGSFKGEGSSTSAADAVVEEIRVAGGEAVANYDSVENGDKIVATAIDKWGRVDVLINNAGILRDVSFHKMSVEDWNLVYKVHVNGSFRVTHAVWPIMREQGYGRIVMTASAAGIYGNFGQANYSMAKLGLYGFSNTLAIEGQRKNILVNTIAPIAGSRMTETVLPPNLLEALKPEYVSPLVARLCHEDSSETGGLYEVGGGMFTKLRWQRSEGKIFRAGRGISVEDVDASFSQVANFDKATHPTTIMESMQPIMDNLEAGPSKGGNEFIDVDQALGYRFPEIQTRYDERDLALYALGVGAASDPSDERDLQLVYEMHGSGMKALPTYGVIPAISALMTLGKQGKQAPGLNYGLDRLLHGEQYTELLRPLPTKATLTHRSCIKEIYDKGKHALVVNEVISYDEQGDALVKNRVTSVIRGAGGWGGDRGPSEEVNARPDREPDQVAIDAVPAHQALLYRLSGDWNPLHADPGFAKSFGFDRPILHGLCTFGYAARRVIEAFAPDGNPDYFKSIQSRFAGSVFPGETIVTEMWKESATRVVFQCKVKGRDKVVISHAAIEFFEEIPKPRAKATAGKSAANQTALVPNTTDIFRAISVYIADNPALVDKVKTIYRFELSAPDSVWTVDLKQGKGAVDNAAGTKPDCTLAISDSDFMDMATGKADAMKLFSSGKLKIRGDIMASQKLGFVKKLTPEMVLAQTKQRADGNGAREADDHATPSSWDVFVAVRDHVERHPELVKQVGFSFLFRITNPDSHWTVDLKSGKGAVAEGEVGKPDCTLQISEQDFIAMTSGEANAMKLFTTGRLKISGNVMASQKLEFLQKIDPEQAKAAVAKARAEGGPAKRGDDRDGKSVPNAGAIFAALSERLKHSPGIAKEVGATIQFVVRDPQDAWFVDLSAATPTVAQRNQSAADATLVVSDADLTSLCKGEVDVRDLFIHGALRVDGDVAAVRRLGIMKGLIA